MCAMADGYWFQWHPLEGVSDGSIHVRASWFHLCADIAEMKKVISSVACCCLARQILQVYA